MPKIKYPSRVSVEPYREPRLVPPRMALSIAEAVQSTSLSKSTLYNLMAAGSLHFVMVRGRRLLPIGEIERLLTIKKVG